MGVVLQCLNLTSDCRRTNRYNRTPLNLAKEIVKGSLECVDYLERVLDAAVLHEENIRKSTLLSRHLCAVLQQHHCL